jgi:Flp pilus assembly pilin Flp
MLKAIKRLFKDESGQGMVEYALVIGVIVVALFIAFKYTPIHTAIENLLTGLTGHMTTPTGT